MLKVFTVHDKASDTYLPPFTMATERDAMEGFREVCKDEKTNYYKFPADFTLMVLGTYDIRNAQFDLCEKKILTNAAALKES